MEKKDVHKTALYRANRNKVKDKKALLKELKKLVGLTHPYLGGEFVIWNEENLWAAFMWIESPQGFDYWEILHEQIISGE